MKKCYTCLELKELSDFNKNKSRHDGLSSQCKVCHRHSTSLWRKNNPDKARASNKAWYLENKEYAIAKTQDWQKSNPERYKEIRKKTSSNWQTKNKDVVSSNSAKRRARKLESTPSWAELDLIKTVYSKAKELGSHVDHIVPLKSKTVCGLHCWTNLQILPPETNTSKGNREWPDMP